MRIKSRLFPYPVLNNNKMLSDYKEGVSFELMFDSSENMSADGFLKLKGIHIESNDGYLTDLLRAKMIKGVLIVECSSTVFRKKFEITNEPRDIKIPIDEFEDDVDISTFIYATEDIEKYYNPNFLDSYSGFSFKIEKYCILAADDGFTVKVNKRPEIENKKSSIFTVVRDIDSTENLVRYKMGNRKISIYLPDKHFEYYNAIKRNRKFLNASFATIAVPVLSECLINIRDLMKRDEDKTVEDICFDYPWFRSVCKAYEREKGTKLQNSSFRDDIVPMELLRR